MSSGDASSGGRVPGLIGAIPLVRQISQDPLGLGNAARPRRSEWLVARTAAADRVVQSVCPQCAVGCGQRVYVKDEDVIQIEGDSDSPVSRGRLCPKGAGSLGLVKTPTRDYRVKYRRPYGTDAGRVWYWCFRIVGRLPSSIAKAVSPYRPNRAGAAAWTIHHGPHIPAPWEGFALFCRYTLLSLVTVSRLLVRRNS